MLLMENFSLRGVENHLNGMCYPVVIRGVADASTLRQ